MSDNVPETTIVPETELSQTPDPFPEYTESDVTIVVPTRPTVLQTFAAQTAGSLVVAIAAPILSSVLLSKIEERKVQRAEKKARKAQEKLEEAEAALQQAQAEVVEAENLTETKTTKK